MGQFTKAWKALGVRLPTGDDHPEITDEKYCLYDERHKDYGYASAYVNKLIRECSTEQGFRALLGTASKDKVTGQWVREGLLRQVVTVDLFGGSVVRCRRGRGHRRRVAHRRQCRSWPTASR